MRCAACDRILSPFEAVQRAPESGQIVDLCNVCFRIAFELSEDEEADDMTLIYFEESNYEQDW